MGFVKFVLGFAALAVTTAAYCLVIGPLMLLHTACVGLIDWIKWRWRFPKERD
jgi:hypothetical protein